MAAKPSSPLKTVILIGLFSLGFYIAFFSWMEHRRYKNGPWEVTFTAVDSTPALLIHHAKSGLTNITILFPGGEPATNLPQTVRFQHGQVAPLDLPFGKCVFLDTLFLPGTVACEMFGHQIQLMPHTLTIDRTPHPWAAGEKILLTNRNSATLSP
ncbi:MAG: hypothetical protein QM813_10565 [Verrucomicrobiota bacterium]